ncbi:MAG: cell surface protein SprA [Bacteroidaceae bacterium]|nr:cell surface protein SprA [Bacteroidaceae bacterium]
MKQTLRNILYILLVMTSMSAIAEVSNSHVFSSELFVSEKTTTTPSPQEAPDTVKVKKTDYPNDLHGEQFSMDLQDPENLKPDTAVYDEKSGLYKVGTKLGDGFLSQPWMMTPEEYLRWNEKKSFRDYFKVRNDSLFVTKGKDKFDFSNMHFDLGPAEKIFGPGGVQISTRGSAELKFGYSYKFTDNPSLSERSRKTKAFDFDEKINMSVDAKVGDKMGFNINYNTESTFDFDKKNLKLAYEGKEDEIVKKLEGGYVDFPTNSSLIKGSQALFGIRTDLQFGKLKLQTVVSQKKSQSTTVNSRGGNQLATYEIQAYEYDENRHFFLAHYFHDTYDRACSTLPNITSGITINRIELWITNTGGETQNTRNIIGLVDLAENQKITNGTWVGSGSNVPSNGSNTLYSQMVSTYNDARNMDQTSVVLDPVMQGGIEYEKVENARLLSSSDYTLNQHLGYVSLKTTLQANQVLAVAYEYTYNGQTYQVGEFSADQKDNDKALYVKLLKNTSNSPRMGNWDLMMKNVYDLRAVSIQREKFKMDIKYLSDTTGVNLNYIPEEKFKQTTLLKMLNLDRLDDNDKTNPNGRFDFIEGYTIQSQTGRVIFPVVEPFGDWLRQKIGNDAIADKYCYDELYDSTKTVAKQIAEKNKFSLVGEYKASSGSVIHVSDGYIPQGSVIVTAGGVTLTENTDYTVSYSTGDVTIINQSIIDAGTNVSVSLENVDAITFMRKTMMGVNWEYDFTKNFNIGGTWMKVSEKPLYSKVTMGSEPLNNTIWGFHMNWKQNSQWLTNMLDKLPFLNLSAPSSISFTGEYAQLKAGESKETQGNASYLDDFEDTRTALDVSNPKEWTLSSTPSHLQYGKLSNDVKYGYNRARLAWYNIEPLFTRRSSSLTPAHIKNDLDQLSNHYVREVYVREVYPNRDTNMGESNTLSILNMAYYPNERGPYNLDTDVDEKGHLNNPKQRWGGMMRKIDQSDFESSNVQYIEFWMLDPFIYSKNDHRFGGDFYINLGDISEDVLKDGKKFYESGMPVNSASTYTETTWGRVPSEKSVVYSFSNESGARQRQDIGLNGLADADERTYGIYADYLNAIKDKVSQAVYDSIYADPAGDDYHYFRGSDFDANRVSILDRYKRINSPEGNSPNTSESQESYSTAYKSTPDAEDVNSDYTMNEYENFFEYHVSLRPEDMVVGRNFIVGSRETSVSLRNGNKEKATWYQFRIPVEEYEGKEGSISDFSSIRFMRMYMTGFEEPVVVRLANLDLVKGEWRNYTQQLFSGDKPSVSGSMVPSSVNIEEHNDKTPVNYVLPPGITRILDPSQPQLTQQNEAALALTVENLATGDARAVYKNLNKDLRHYKHLQMFVHANAPTSDTELQDNQMSIFFRIGSDYKSNYYEYEIPLKLTPAGHYDTYTTQGCKAVWPEENMLDIDFSAFTNLKHERNKARANGTASYTQLYYIYDENRPNNKISIVGNPSLGEVKTMMIGVRNNGRRTGSVEVWVNELRMQDYSNEGGWAAQGNLNVQLSDLGSVNVTGHVETAGFGGIEEGVTERRNDNLYEWGITTQIELGKFFPEKWKMNLPFYYSYSWQKISPKYNPFDTDMLLKDALDECENKAARDSLSNLTESVVKNKNFSLSNWRSGVQSRKPLPFDPANFTVSYSYSQRYKTGETTVYENEENWKFNLSYNYSPKYKPLEPFKNLKGKSKWLDIVKAQNLQWLPQSVSFNTDITRNYYEFQERDIDNSSTKLPVTFSDQFLWNRDLTVRWDIFKAMKMSWTSSTHAEIEEPYVVVNKHLYPDEYSAWKDSVKQSLKSFGRPLTYRSTFTGSYQVPLNKIPLFDWMTADGSYNANYNWTRGTELEDGTSLGHTVNTQRTVNLNGQLNFETLYKKWKFLADTEKRLSGNTKKSNSRTTASKNAKTAAKDTKTSKDKKEAEGTEDAKGQDQKNNKNDKNAKAQNDKNAKAKDDKKSKGFSKEVALNDSTDVEVKHGQNSKRLVVRATTAEGKTYKLKYKKVDANTIKVKNHDSIPVKINVVAKQPLENLTWYKTAQVFARGLMTLRTASISYRNTYSLTLPGFRTEVGDAFGQKHVNGVLSPGLGFAFGAVGDGYIDQAARNGWLMQNDSNITTPASTAAMEDLQLKATLEPFKDFKIDLDAVRTVNKSKRIQFMYDGMPTTQSGSFSMTVISFGSAFESGGNINNNYHSKHFDKFLKNMSVIQERLEQKYASATYPKSAGTEWAGKAYNPENGGVELYSADVMVPAFLSAYCGGNAASTPLDIFPALKRLMPNWSVKYAGLTKLIPWLGDHVKSFNINHAYKSIYSVGAYNSYSNFMEYMGDWGFISNVTTGNPIPSSMYNVSTVSINESFSPFIGVDMSFNSGLTAKLQYNKTRTLNLSMTSVALTENFSNDIVIGLGYKIKDLNLFGAKSIQSNEARKSKSKSKNKKEDTKSSNTNARTRSTISHDLNVKADFSYRLQNALNRNIQTAVTTATSGATAYKLTMQADYTFSRLLTLSGFFDWQRNVPLVSQSAYPTTTADFGVSMKFSLVR